MTKKLTHYENEEGLISDMLAEELDVTPLMVAVSVGNADIVKILLRNKSIDINR